MEKFAVPFNAEEKVINESMAIVEANTESEAFEMVESKIKEGENPFKYFDCQMYGVDTVTIDVLETEKYTIDADEEVVSLQVCLENIMQDVEDINKRVTIKIAEKYKDVEIDLNDICVEEFDRLNFDHIKTLYEAEVYFVEKYGEKMMDYFIDPVKMDEVVEDNGIDKLPIIIRYKDIYIGYALFTVYVDDEDFDFINTIEFTRFYLKPRFQHHGIYSHVLKCSKFKELQEEYPNYILVSWNDPEMKDFIEHKKSLGFKIEKTLKDKCGFGKDVVKMVRKNKEF